MQLQRLHLYPLALKSPSGQLMYFYYCYGYNNNYYLGNLSAQPLLTASTGHLVQQSAGGSTDVLLSDKPISSSDQSAVEAESVELEAPLDLRLPKKTAGSCQSSDRTDIENRQPTTTAANQAVKQPHRQHVCDQCGKAFSTVSNLRRHSQTHRSYDSRLARSCQHCGKVYLSMPALSMHLQTHVRKYQCHFCDKRFSRYWLLSGHIRSHTGEKPFQCDQCGRGFSDRSNMRSHLRVHRTSTAPRQFGKQINSSAGT